ncbi:MAG: hypothetical protein K8T20_06930 [Planctomycetes bacterium]|nr:hypothetical protein [Planctomycetota bacterium]
MRRLALLVMAASLAFADGKAAPVAKDVELKKTIAAGLADMAAWAQPKKLMAEGRALVDEALVLDPACAKAKDLQPELAGDSAASASDKKEWEAKSAAFGKKVAPLYIDLSKQKHAPKDDTVFDGYFVRAYEWAPKEVGPLIDAAWREALGKKDWDHAYRLISGAERVQTDPARAKALKEVELHEGEKKALLRKASNHDMQYYLVLPKDWDPKKKWPIMVYVEGAGCNFKPAIENWGEQRGDFNCILITPQGFSNTNALADMKGKYTYTWEFMEPFDKDSEKRFRFDEAGLLNVLDDVRKEFNGEDKIYITGFSGGGNLTWRMIFGHPDLLVCAAPACPNFYMSLELSTAAERETLPVKVFQGDKDENLAGNLEPGWQNAKKICDEKGWKNVSRVMVPGRGHDTCMKEVLEFFKSQKK